jgi:zinc D-Ala-D-Ala dipeptidase
MNLADYSKKLIPVSNNFRWEGAKKVKIEESGEKLLSLNLIPEKFIARPQYFIQGIKGALPECYIREGAYDKLLEAAEKLPKGYKFLIYDAWRPEKVQNALYKKFQKEMIRRCPAKNEKEINSLVEEYVAFPSHKKKSPSPHLTGGAVDLTIIDDKGKKLEMGTEFDDTREETHSDYYERVLKKRELTEQEKEILQNRRLLYHTLILAGFTNYPCEWWHYDFGNQVWAYISNQKIAFYGVSSPNLRWKYDD